MEQFKVLPGDQRYHHAWYWLHGYLEAAFESDKPFTQPRLRQLLDRMEQFADVLQPVSPTQAKVNLELVMGIENEYNFAWITMIGYLEAAYHFGRKGLSKPNLKHVIDEMESFTSIY